MASTNAQPSLAQALQDRQNTKTRSHINLAVTTKPELHKGLQEKIQKLNQHPSQPSPQPIFCINLTRKDKKNQITNKNPNSSTNPKMINTNGLDKQLTTTHKGITKHKDSITHQLSSKIKANRTEQKKKKKHKPFDFPPIPIQLSQENKHGTQNLTFHRLRTLGEVTVRDQHLLVVRLLLLLLQKPNQTKQNQGQYHCSDLVLRALATIVGTQIRRKFNSDVRNESLWGSELN